MCEVRLSPASGSESVATTRPSPVRGNRATGGAASSCDLRAPSRYRVLRAASLRGGPRSVDRECAGRNAKSSVKEVEPRQSVRSVVAEHVWPSPGNRLSEGSTSREAGTTGVQDHSMHTRQVAVRLRSAAPLADSPRPKPATGWEGLMPDSPATTSQKSDALVVASKRPTPPGGSFTPPSEGGHGE
jgi:hypothetical protein